MEEWERDDEVEGHGHATQHLMMTPTRLHLASAKMVEVCCVVLGRQLLGLCHTRNGWKFLGAGARAARAPVAMLRASAVDLLLVSLLTTVVHAGPQNLNIHCRAHQPSRTNPRIIIKLT